MDLLLFLHSDDQFLTPERIDAIVCAELPDSIHDTDGELSAIIMSCMAQGPCGELAPRSPCMQGQGSAIPTCSKCYPTEFQHETRVQEDRYPIYRKRNDERKIALPV